MRHETVTIPASHGIDWKGIGYLFSIAGVLLLGAKAIPKPSDPWWHWLALGLGMVASIVGFGLRYVSHLKQRREIEQVERQEAQRR
jgi:hypothetical protein